MSFVDYGCNLDTPRAVAYYEATLANASSCPHRAPSLISVLLNAINEECAVELRHELLEGRAELPRVGAVLPARGSHPPYIVVNG